VCALTTPAASRTARCSTRPSVGISDSPLGCLEESGRPALSRGSMKTSPGRARVRCGRNGVEDAGDVGTDEEGVLGG
jgi:hypothetical protein